ncbi:hypothetical protein [Variovorax boronicumulans]|uniref:hypothetical protein n=1 Tax=Variovorax boronicumulans TaxID=436515 RepID=UPI001C55FEC8
MIPAARRNWKQLQPTSIRHAMELCKDHARERLNRSVEGIAAEMGLTDHWTLYKWLQNGRIPANLVIPFENACGIDFLTRWLAASKGRLLVEIPNGRPLKSKDVVELHNGFSAAVKLLTDFYAGKAESVETMAALSAHLGDMAWHRANVAQHSNPEFDFNP